MLIGLSLNGQKRYWQIRNFPKSYGWKSPVQSSISKNRSPTSSLDGKTPYEAWHGKKPDLSHLHIIGCTAYVHVSKDTHRKLDFNTRECRLVGYGGTNQWRAWDEEKEDVVVSRDVIFDEQPI